MKNKQHVGILAEGFLLQLSCWARGGAGAGTTVNVCSTCAKCEEAYGCRTLLRQSVILTVLLKSCMLEHGAPSEARLLCFMLIVDINSSPKI